MVSHRYRCIFIHIPKTAGRSIVEAFGEPFAANAFAAHQTASALRQEVGETVWNSYFKFAFTRNPWDRMFSLYSWRPDQPPESAEPREWLQHRGYLHWPVWDYITEDDQILVDFVGRFENLAHDFRKVCRLLGAEVDLQHWHRNRHAHYSTWYDEEMKAIVAEQYAKDIEHFGYTFETP